MGVRPSVALVTGYVPIQGHPRTAAEYGELGDNMFGKLQGDFYVHPFYETIQEMWLTKLIQDKFPDVSHSAGDDPKKNTLAYHCVQHQKFAWMLKAYMANPLVETLVWLDYGIGHVPGVTPDVVNEFMTKVRKEFAIPGCWPKEGLLVNDFFPCWRFCGGLMVMPAKQVYWTYKCIKETLIKHLKKTNNVSWEVSTLARAEDRLPPVRWYKADHNQTMFTNYGDEPCAPVLSPAPLDQLAVT